MVSVVYRMPLFLDREWRCTTLTLVKFDCLKILTILLNQSSKKRSVNFISLFWSSWMPEQLAWGPDLSNNQTILMVMQLFRLWKALYRYLLFILPYKSSMIVDYDTNKNLFWVSIHPCDVPRSAGRYWWRMRSGDQWAEWPSGPDPVVATTSLHSHDPPQQPGGATPHP